MVEVNLIDKSIRISFKEDVLFLEASFGIFASVSEVTLIWMNSIFEAALFSKPVILVRLPHSISLSEAASLYEVASIFEV